MSDLYTLGRAMREAQKAFDSAQDWEGYENRLADMEAAEAAFDKALAALSPSPASPAIPSGPGQSDGSTG